MSGETARSLLIASAASKLPFAAGQLLTTADGSLEYKFRAGLPVGQARQKLQELGFIPIGGTAAFYARSLAEETEKWRKVIQTADIKPE